MFYFQLKLKKSELEAPTVDILEAKQIKELKSNPYVYKVTKHKLYYTAKFKEDFWVSYQAGNAPRKILLDLGFDLTMFGQKP